MVSGWHIIPLLLVTVVLADYYVDNANTSVVYSMAPSQSGPGWQTFSAGTQSLALSFSNSTGNYTIPLDASHCYDENYASGVCGSADNCFVQLPFTGSGITMYVFNAGASGMTASFSIDGGTAVSASIEAPLPSTNYQVSNVSLYDIQGLQSGNHSMKMTVLDWNGSHTSMKFDYAYINETFVAPPATTAPTSSIRATSTSQTTSQTPTHTSIGNSSTSNKINLAGVIGGILGGIAVIAILVIGFFYFRKRRATSRHEEPPLDSLWQATPFNSQYSENTPTPPPAPYTSQMPFLAQHGEASPSVSPFQRSAILRDALAGSRYLSVSTRGLQSIDLAPSSPISHSLPPQTSQSTDANQYESVMADAGSLFADPQIPSGHDLTVEQLEVIDRLRMDRVPAETIQRVIENFMSPGVTVGDVSSEQFTHGRSILSAAPPSYRTRAS